MIEHEGCRRLGRTWYNIFFSIMRLMVIKCVRNCEKEVDEAKELVH